jgi:hypothetical protein
MAYDEKLGCRGSTGAQPDPYISAIGVDNIIPAGLPLL